MASQDGFLRIFNYDTMEPVGRARSYFGGFLCVCWSPDGKYVVCGGEDDLVTVYRYFLLLLLIKSYRKYPFSAVLGLVQFTNRTR